MLDVEVALAAPPKRPLGCCGCEAAGVIEEEAPVDGVVEEVEVMPPKRLGFDPGGGPAGVVEVLPNKEPPVGAGVADEGVPPKRLPPPDPNIEPPTGGFGSDGFAGVPKRAWPPLLAWGWPPRPEPKEGVVLPVAAPALPNIEGFCVAAGPAPSCGEDPVPVEDGAPTFPKRPPLVPAFEVFGVEPKVLPAVPNRPPLDAPLEDGGPPKEKDMVMCCRDQGNRQAWVEKNTGKPTGERYKDRESCRVDRQIRESDATLNG